MNVIQNGADLGLTTEYKRTNDTTKNTHSGTVDNRENEITTEDKINVIHKSATEEVVTNQPLTVKQLEKVAQQLQDFVGDLNRNIEFSVDEDSGRDVIKVIDKDSGDLLKQYPSEEVLTLVSKLSDMVGGFVDEKA